jgi:L-seryl-tRNA(Ser) seleniumtransferase
MARKPTLQLVDSRRALPSVTKVLAELGALPHGLAVAVARAVVDEARARAEAGNAVEEADVLAGARHRAAEIERSLLQPVINATGVIVHTNLGRAPLGSAPLGAVAEVAAGYSNLEFRLDRGVRGSRQEHAGALLAQACGAEAALVVNNNAAAVLLVLAALARGREVIVSRGELVEIGGGFRVPDVMAESGARLVEVGTTNRTRRADYERALTPETALILRVHASNYRMVGFVESAPVEQLAALGPPVVADIGSGLLDESTPWLAERPSWLRDEPGALQTLAAGASLVTFSGDKLLGGPQAGVIAGRADLVATVARHPLARAVRADKMALAALQSVALAYLAGDGDAIPLWRMAATPVSALRERAEALAATVPGAKVVDTEAVAGGGSLPGLTIPSCGVSIEVADADTALTTLRSAGIVARVDAGAVVCDLRTVDPSADARLATALATITS